MVGQAQPVQGRRRRLRSDAERNRARILTAATEAFAEQGIAAGVDAIARRAGLGTATLYRHFPTKDALVDAVLSERIGALVAISSEATSVRDIVHRIVDFQVEDRSFRDLLAWRDLSAEDPQLGEFTDRVRATLDRSQETGELRKDVSFEDFVLLLIALDGAADSAEVLPVEVLHRIADVVVDGLLGERSELTGPQVAFAEVHRAAKIRRG